MKFIKNFFIKIFGKINFKKTKIKDGMSYPADHVLEDTELIDKEPNEPIFADGTPKQKRAIPIMKYAIVAAVFVIILLVGVVAGILITRHKPVPPKIKTEETYIPQKTEKIASPAFSPLDPVSGDWGIGKSELMSRMNLTLDKIGARRSIIKKFLEVSDDEFRYSFSASLQLLGENKANGNITRVALSFDPVYSPAEYQTALALIRAVITAIAPVFSRDEIIVIENELGLSQDINPPKVRRSEYRYKNFVFQVWSIAGSAFVFSASSQ